MNTSGHDRRQFGFTKRDFKGDLLCFDCWNSEHHPRKKVTGCECKCTEAKRVVRPVGKGEQLVIDVPSIEVK